MHFNMLLTFVIATIACFLSLGLALPTTDDSSATSLNPRYGEFGFDWQLFCGGPPQKNYVSAPECWRRFRTFCDGTGAMKNQFSRYCNTKTCSCQKRSGVVLPGFSDPSPEEIAWSMNMNGAESYYVNARDIDLKMAVDSPGTATAVPAITVLLENGNIFANRNKVEAPTTLSTTSTPESTST